MGEVNQYDSKSFYHLKSMENIVYTKFKKEKEKLV